jgi:ribosomal protein S8E
VNICVGIRWLYRKHQIAKYYLKKEPTEFQLAEEYKGIRNDKSVGATKQRKAFRNYQNELKKVKRKK